MGDDVNWIISILYQNQLLKLAVKFSSGVLSDDQIENYFEPENKEAIRNTLPNHLKNLGPIVDIYPIFDVYIVHKGE